MSAPENSMADLESVKAVLVEGVKDMIYLGSEMLKKFSNYKDQLVAQTTNLENLQNGCDWYCDIIHKCATNLSHFNNEVSAAARSRNIPLTHSKTILVVDPVEIADKDVQTTANDESTNGIPDHETGKEVATQTEPKLAESVVCESDTRGTVFTDKTPEEIVEFVRPVVNGAQDSMGALLGLFDVIKGSKNEEEVSEVTKSSSVGTQSQDLQNDVAKNVQITEETQKDTRQHIDEDSSTNDSDATIIFDPRDHQILAQRNDFKDTQPLPAELKIDRIEHDDMSTLKATMGALPDGSDGEGSIVFNLCVSSHAIATNELDIKEEELDRTGDDGAGTSGEDTDEFPWEIVNKKLQQPQPQMPPECDNPETNSRVTFDGTVTPDLLSAEDELLKALEESVNIVSTSAQKRDEKVANDVHELESAVVSSSCNGVEGGVESDTEVPGSTNGLNDSIIVPEAEPVELEVFINGNQSSSQYDVTDAKSTQESDKSRKIETENTLNASTIVPESDPIEMEVFIDNEIAETSSVTDQQSDKFLLSDPEMPTVDDHEALVNIKLQNSIKQFLSDPDGFEERSLTEEDVMDIYKEEEPPLVKVYEEDAVQDEIIESIKNDEVRESDFSESDLGDTDFEAMSGLSDFGSEDLDSVVESPKRKKVKKLSTTDSEESASSATVAAIQDCCVKVERLYPEKIKRLIQEVKTEAIKKEDREFNRLTNLKSLKHKRKLHNSTSESGSSTKSTPRKKSHRCSKSGHSKWSDSEAFDLDSSASLSASCDEVDREEDVSEERLVREVLPEDLELDLIRGFEFPDDEGSMDADCSSSEQEEDIGERRMSKKEKTRSLSVKKKDKNSNWRNDPLLKGKLSSSSESESDGSEKRAVRKRIHFTSTEEEGQKENISPNVMQGEEKLGDSDASTEPYVKSEDDFKILPKYEVSSINLDPSTVDSDVEFMSNEPKKKPETSTPICISESDSDDEPGGKRGRRNIRALMSDVLLDEATKKANKEEEARRSRISQKQKSLDSFLSQQTQSVLEEEGLVLDIDEDSHMPLIAVNSVVTLKMKEHQCEGVRFMWNACYESVKQLKGSVGSGCILAHCMGLGKTFQVVALVHTLFKHPVTKTKHVLVVCPLSTVSNWKNEFAIGQKGLKNKVRVYELRDTKKEEKHKEILNWWNYSGVLVMGYEAYEKLTKDEVGAETPKEVMEALVDPGPELIVCDEGHLLKNGKTIRTKALMKVKTRRRIVLTGTPLQNNLKEYYHMVQFVKPNLLGTFKEFSNRFVNPISNGQYDDSTPGDIHVMKKRSHVLHKLLKDTIQRYEVTELQQYLPEKLDYVLFIRLHPVQADLYKEYINKLQDTSFFAKGKLFAHYNLLQNVTSHPYLLYLKEKKMNSSKKKEPKEVDVIVLDPEPKDNELSPDWWKDRWSDDYAKSIEYGSKFKVMAAIIDECLAVDDKVLIFSSSLPELDAIEHFLKLQGTASKKDWHKNHDFYRLDGTVPPDVRPKLCDNFNHNKNVRVFLMSHKVGGLGLNLVAANRVIIMGVNWNPVYESQSIFRTYRFGQQKKCFIYRLVAMGTMEEVVYERSITKLAVACRVVDEHQISRHYKSKELQEMFRLNLNLEEPRPLPKPPVDGILANLLMTLKQEIFKYHEHQALLENRPDEELNEEEMKLAWEEYNNEKKGVPLPNAPKTDAEQMLALRQQGFPPNYEPWYPGNQPFDATAVDPLAAAPRTQGNNRIVQGDNEIVLNDIFEVPGGPSNAATATQEPVVPKIMNVYASRGPTVTRRMSIGRTGPVKEVPAMAMPVIVKTTSLHPTEFVDVEHEELVKDLSRNGVTTIPLPKWNTPVTVPHPKPAKRSLLRNPAAIGNHKEQGNVEEEAVGTDLNEGNDVESASDVPRGSLSGKVGEITKVLVPGVPEWKKRFLDSLKSSSAALKTSENIQYGSMVTAAGPSETAKNPSSTRKRKVSDNFSFQKAAKEMYKSMKLPTVPKSNDAKANVAPSVPRRTYSDVSSHPITERTKVHHSHRKRIKFVNMKHALNDHDYETISALQRVPNVPSSTNHPNASNLPHKRGVGTAKVGKQYTIQVQSILNVPSTSAPQNHPPITPNRSLSKSQTKPTNQRDLLRNLGVLRNETHTNPQLPTSHELNAVSRSVVALASMGNKTSVRRPHRVESRARNANLFGQNDENFSLVYPNETYSRQRNVERERQTYDEPSVYRGSVGSRTSGVRELSEDERRNLNSFAPTGRLNVGSREAYFGGYVDQGPRRK